MDFSSLNPKSSNSLNIAARNNDTQAVKRLLKKINPNCIDNRGWTCLHEAAANDSYECLKLIIKHRDCRHLVETHEGYTALYLACRHGSSLKTIKLLLDIEDIVNYCSIECVTPLHVVSSLGRLDVLQLLIDFNALIDVQDFDGDTPLHDAALAKQHETVAILLHAGADADIKNHAGFTPLHLACTKGCSKTVQNLLPFISDINQTTNTGDTYLMLAVHVECDEVLKLLLQHGADPHIVNEQGELPLYRAMINGYSSIFKILFSVTNRQLINKDIINHACKPHIFNFDILDNLLNSDLGPEFFDVCPPFYDSSDNLFHRSFITINNPLNSYLDVCEYVYNQSVEKFKEFFYMYLLRGLDVNVYDVNKCPPIVYIHYRPHSACFTEVLKILREHNCDIDYTSMTLNEDNICLPDAFIASLKTDPTTLLKMLPYSLKCEPSILISFICKHTLGITPQPVKTQLLSVIDKNLEKIDITSFRCYVLCLKHLCRVQIRKVLKESGKIKTTNHFLEAIQNIPLPPSLKDYLHYS